MKKTLSIFLAVSLLISVIVLPVASADDSKSAFDTVFEAISADFKSTSVVTENGAVCWKQDVRDGYVAFDNIDFGSGGVQSVSVDANTAEENGEIFIWTTEQTTSTSSITVSESKVESAMLLAYVPLYKMTENNGIYNGNYISDIPKGIKKVVITVSGCVKLKSISFKSGQPTIDGSDDIFGTSSVYNYKAEINMPNLGKAQNAYTSLHRTDKPWVYGYKNIKISNETDEVTLHYYSAYGLDGSVQRPVTMWISSGDIAYTAKVTDSSTNETALCAADGTTIVGEKIAMVDHKNIDNLAWGLATVKLDKKLQPGSYDIYFTGNSNGFAIQKFRFEDGSISLAKTPVNRYIENARLAYANGDYQNRQIIDKSIDSNDYYNLFYDRPNAVKLSWKEIDGATSYTLQVSETSNFENVYEIKNIAACEYDLYNLKTNTKYYWKVISGNTESAISEIVTKNTVRFINVDGVRNVRDIGGWNGLNQGKVYRGSELNNVNGHGLAVTDAGKDVMLNQLGIKTDLDLRGIEEGGNLTSSPLGSDITFLQHGSGSYDGIYNASGKAIYNTILADFAKSENYPIYVHCWGGADRTGSIAFLLEGLCGVNESKLSMDYELTSFSQFGVRRRSGTTSYKYPEMVSAIKTYSGNTLKEKFESYALSVGLNYAQISNIQSILSGNGAAFVDADKLNFETNKEITIELTGVPSGVTITGIKTNGIDNIFTKAENKYTFTPQSYGMGEIVMSDGQTMKFSIDGFDTERYAGIYQPFEMQDSIKTLDKHDKVSYVLSNDTMDGSESSVYVTVKKDKDQAYHDNNLAGLKKPNNGDKVKLSAQIKLKSDLKENYKNLKYYVYCTGTNSNGETKKGYKEFSPTTKLIKDKWVQTEVEYEWNDSDFSSNGSLTIPKDSAVEFRLRVGGGNVLSHGFTNSKSDGSIRVADLEYLIDNVNFVVEDGSDAADVTSLYPFGKNASIKDISLSGDIEAFKTVKFNYQYELAGNVDNTQNVSADETSSMFVAYAEFDGVKRYLGSGTLEGGFYVTPAAATANKIIFDIYPMSNCGLKGTVAHYTAIPASCSYITVDGKSGIAMCRSNCSQEADLYYAVYNIEANDKNLDSVKIDKAKFANGIYQYTLPQIGTSQQLKMMYMWHDDCEPLCEAATVN